LRSRFQGRRVDPPCKEPVKGACCCWFHPLLRNPFTWPNIHTHTHTHTHTHIYAHRIIR
jgi:hypothetical protein